MINITRFIERTNISPPKLIILDVDGVMNTGGKFYTQQDCSVISKSFNDLDFTAIKAFKALGIRVVWLSGDENINRDVAKNRNIDFIFSRNANGEHTPKASFLPEIMKTYQVTKSDIWFVGDDVMDLSMADNVSLSCCLSNSPKIMRSKFDITIPRKSGDYVICWLVDFLCEYFEFDYPSEAEIAFQELNEKQRYTND